MAKIMIEAKTQEKERKASSQPDNTKWTDAVSKIVVFDDVETDSVSFGNFQKLADENNEWWFLNTAGYMNIVDEQGRKNKKYYQARRAKLTTSSDEEMVLTVERQELPEADLETQVIDYKLKKEVVDAFAMVAKQTSMNESEMIQRRINASKENVQFTGLTVSRGQTSIYTNEIKKPA